MKQEFLILLTLIPMASGCASMITKHTIHEICTDPETASRYKDYDQCYAEESALRQRKLAALHQASQSFSNIGKTQYQPVNIPQTTNCTSQVIGNQVYTNCN